MIPKIIHYVWVGGGVKSPLIESCIESWKKYLPGYEIIEWGDDALPLIDNVYVQQAYAAKKWAFVSDYLRLYALYHHGGLYFDSDLEVTADLERFLSHDFFSGFEDYKGHVSPITALMGARAGSPLIKYLLDDYSERLFVRADGSYDLTPNTQRISEIFERRFSVAPPYDSEVALKMHDDVIIYPSFFFCTPKEGRVNYSVHHFNGSWLDGYSRKKYVGFLSYSLLRFKRRKNGSCVIPLLDGEEVVFKVGAGRKYVFAVLKCKR